MADKDAKILRLLYTVLTPDCCEQHTVRGHLPRMPRQINQEIEFLGRQVHVAVFHSDATCLNINPEVPDLNERSFRLLRCGGTPESGSYPCQQFIDAEWFCNVVVCASIERFHLDLFLTFDGEDNDWHTRFHPNMPAQLKAVHVRHSEIRDDQRGGPFAHALSCLL